MVKNKKPSDLPTRWLSEEEQDLWRAYLGSWFRLSKLLNDDMEEHSGFDHLTYEIFVHLSENENRSLRMSELANRVSTQKSRLTYRISQLEKQGYVQRRGCEEDGRGQWCTMTPQGYELLKDAAPYHVQAVLTHFIEQISPGDVKKMTRILNAIADDASTSDAL